MRVSCLALLSVWLIANLALSQGAAREVVAELNGQPIYRDELGEGELKDVARELQRRISGELFTQFAKENPKQLQVTEEEIERVTAYFNEQHTQKLVAEGESIKQQIAEISAKLVSTLPESAERKALETKRADLELQLNRPPPNEETVKFILTNWKYQYVLYKKYKGGRLLWQQFGIEAYDATRVFLETEEKNGRFKILDPQLRDEFYFYWTKQNHGSFLIVDPVRIRAEFLEPEWMGKTLSLQQLKYNHEDLAVDLGVGLWAWPVPMDADDDGDLDLLVSCPDKPSNGVWFFENVDGDTARQPLPIFRAGRKISSTVHYVMPSYLNNEVRVLSPGFEYLSFAKTGTESKKALPISAKFYKPQGTQTKGPKVRHNQWRYVDFDGDEKLDLIVGIEDWSYYGWDDAWNSEGQWTNGPLHGFVLIFKNQGTDSEPKYAEPFKLEAGEETLDVFGCPSPNFIDFDHDGDLDLLCGEFLDRFTYFENVGSRTSPKYRSGERVRSISSTDLHMDLQMIVPVAIDWNKDGECDLIVGDEDGRVAWLKNSGRVDSRNVPLFEEPRYFQQQADTLKCGALATPFPYDWDSDGDIDILSGNTAGYIEWFENLGRTATNEFRWAAPKRLEVDGQPFRIMAGPNGSIQGPAEAKWGYTTFTVCDWNRDGLADIVFNSIWGQVQWLENTGTKAKPKLRGPKPLEVAWNGPAPKPAWTWWKPTEHELVTQWRTTPIGIDWDKDSWPDLAVLDPEGYPSLYRRRPEDGRLAPPERIFVDQNGKPLRFNERTAGGSGRRKWCLTDWDGDGIVDILLNSQNADFWKGLGEKEGKWEFQHVGNLAAQNIEGHDVSPSTADFDADGWPDFLGGAEDGRFYYLRNPNSPD